MKVLLLVTASIAFVACAHRSTTTSATTTTLTATDAAASQSADSVAKPEGAADASGGDFPRGTVLGAVGLPVYPTPKSNTVVNPAETNSAGETSVSMSLDPHAAIAEVIAWYKARMPNGSFVESGNPDYASFQVGKDGDKVIRRVVIQHVSGHVQTDIILMKKTAP